MTEPAKDMGHIIAGRRDIRFRDFEQLLAAFGFEFDGSREVTGSVGTPRYGCG